MRFLTLQLALFALLASATSNNVDDQPANFDHDPEKLARQLVCDRKSANNPKQSISRVSTIVKLAEYLENLPNGHNLADCASAFGGQLNELKNVVSESKDNVCSDSKLSLIQEFHEKYLSTVASDVEARQASQLEPLAGSLKIFFMFYVLEVSAICRRNLINNLEWDVKDRLSEEDFNLSNGRDMDSIMFGLGEQFSAMKSVNSYDDIIMLWNIVDGSLFAKQNADTLKSSAARLNSDQAAEQVELDNGINPLTGSKIKLFIKSHDASSMFSLQEKCSKRFRPFYEKLILPIIKLADLGYSLTDESFEKEMSELKQNKLVNRWYVITQICETILPIKFVQDKTLNREETVMITKEEAASIEAQQPPVQADQVAQLAEPEAISYEPSTNSMAGIDQLSTLESIGVSKMLQDVKINLSARDRNLKRAISRFAKSALDFVKSKAKRIFFSRKVDKSDAGKEEAYVKEDMGEIVTKSLTDVDVSELNQLQRRGSAKHFGRKKPTVAGHHQEIVREKHRVRLADVEAEKNARDHALSYRHTKSVGQILNEWWTAIKSLAPNKMTIFIAGLGVCLVLILTILISAGTITLG